MTGSRLVGRKLWFTIHKWVGLALFLPLIVVSVTGSLLVWPKWTDSLVNPQRYAVSGRPVALPPSAYADAAARRVQPGDRLASIIFPESASDPVMVTVAAQSGFAPGAAPRQGPPPRTNVWIEPSDASVLDSADASSGLTRMLHQLHGSLMVPGLGRKIVGWLGWAMFASCLTGIWLWWPTIGSALRGLRWRRGPLFTGNLHHQVGIWIVLPLAVLSFTGAYISFPNFFGGVERIVAGGQGQGGPGGGNRRAPPAETTRLTVDAAVATAGIAPGELRSVRYPTEASPKWVVASARGEAEVDDATGTVAAAEERGGVARFMRQLHDGHEYNAIWQTIIFLGGLAPLALGITGVVMWWKTRGWRARAAARA